MIILLSLSGFVTVPLPSPNSYSWSQAIKFKFRQIPFSFQESMERLKVKIFSAASSHKAKKVFQQVNLVNGYSFSDKGPLVCSFRIKQQCFLGHIGIQILALYKFTNIFLSVLHMTIIQHLHKSPFIFVQQIVNYFREIICSLTIAQILKR